MRHTFPQRLRSISEIWETETPITAILNNRFLGPSISKTIESFPKADCWVFTRYDEAIALLTSYNLIHFDHDASRFDMHNLVPAITIMFIAQALPIQYSAELRDFFRSVKTVLAHDCE